MTALNIIEGETWALIPARGGSKSVPLKNMAPLGGRPLIGYAIEAARQCGEVREIHCSTDHPAIQSFCEENRVTVQARPNALSGDNCPTLDVLLYFIEKIQQDRRAVPEFLVLLEPTSPFVLPVHITDCVGMIRRDENLDSTQTVTQPPPNHHAYNQRYIENGHMFFSFRQERENRFNKQSKPLFYVHGNVRVMRTLSLTGQKDIFGKKSKPIVIPREYALDADGPEDFRLAECMLSCGLVSLSHLEALPEPEGKR